MLTMLDDNIHLSYKKIGFIAKDAIKTAEVANLVYVKDAEPGIRRIKNGKSFAYALADNKNLRDRENLERIKKLVISPAWEYVWICVAENGHLQATGIDVKRRKQHRYRPLLNSFRNHTKFYRLHEFGTALPKMRAQLEKDLLLPGLEREKILALVVTLIEQTNIRVGNGQYEKIYGSYGLTTLKDKHVKFSGSVVQFTFKGKKGVHHAISLNNKRLTILVKQCRDIPGKELFQYYEGNNTHHSIDRGMVNEYIKRIRQTQTKKKIVVALDIVSGHLGNTRTVCKKYYVHPVIISLYETTQIKKYFSELDKIKPKPAKASELSCEENILMKIFEKEALILKHKS